MKFRYIPLSLLLFASGCTNLPKTPDEIDSLDSLDSFELIYESYAMDGLNPDIICKFGENNFYKIFKDKESEEEIWIKEKEGDTYLGRKNYFDKTLIRIEDRFYIWEVPTYLISGIGDEDWSGFWKGKLDIEDLGENKLGKNKKKLEEFLDGIQTPLEFITGELHNALNIIRIWEQNDNIKNDSKKIEAVICKYN